MEMNHNNDYKYMIQDINRIYLGANYQYEEIIENEDIPFKLKEAVNRIFLKDTDRTTTIAGHLAKLQETEMSYLAYHQLKIKIKVTELKKTDGIYHSGYYTFDEYIKQYQEKTRQEEAFVEEIIIKKLQLLAFSI